VKNKRREFINLLPYILVGGFGYPISKFLFFNDKPNRRFSLAVKEIKDGITYLKPSQTFIYKNQNQITIYDAHCTHMGCILKFNEEKNQFNCPCHQSRFDVDGIKLRGPAKRDLDRVDFKIKNRTVFVG